MSSVTATDLISSFEEEQKTLVFSSLSDYLHHAVFTDVTLYCRGGHPVGHPVRPFRAHKTVLAASSKFFRELFRQNPGITEIDLDHELAPNDLTLTFEDVRLLVGILYCVGTLDISPQRVQSLLVVAQVLGIPTLIRFLKKIKSSLDETRNESFTHDYGHGDRPNRPPPPSGKLVAAEGGFPVISSQLASLSGAFQNRIGKQERCETARANEAPGEEEEVNVPVSRPPSRATLASLNSLALQHLPSPNPHEVETNQLHSHPHPSRVVSSVLESFDPSFLNNMPANQIDDLENALLPHLQNEDDASNQADGNRRSQNTDAMHCSSPLPQENLTEPIPSTSNWTSPVDRPASKGIVLLSEMRPRPMSGEPLNLSTNEPLTPMSGIRPAVPSDMQPGPSDPANDMPPPPPQCFSQLLPSGSQNLSAEPVVLRPQPLLPVPSAPVPFAIVENATADKETEDDTMTSIDCSSEEEETASRDESGANKNDDEGLVIDEERPVSQLSTGPSTSQAPSESRPVSQLSNRETAAAASETDAAETKGEESNGAKGGANEIKVSLERVSEGKSFKFAIPGSSKSVTLNFSADALQEMRNSVKPGQEGKASEQLHVTCSKSYADSQEQLEVTSSTKDVEDGKEPSKKRESLRVRRSRKKLKRRSDKKSDFPCTQCSKAYPTKSLLDKHLQFHKSNNVNCNICGQVFLKHWALEEHMAVEHKKGQALKCEECGKEFRWSRNLLAHMQLHHHQKEKRHRCKLCPLTFLQRKNYIKHQKTKHPEHPPTWCQLCFEIFDCAKQREDHECTKVENDGQVLRCHQHDPPMEFQYQDDLDKHLQEHQDETSVSTLQKSCPVCHKKFLMKRNLLMHLRRFHAGEQGDNDDGGGNGDSGGGERRFRCGECGKTFLYRSDRDEHENKHRGIREFKCHCGRAYCSRKALLFHQKLVHDSEGKVHQCTICDKVLSNQYKLKYHMKVHTEKRAFACSFCKKEFKARENLSKHINKFHKPPKEAAAAKEDEPTTSVVGEDLMVVSTLRDEAGDDEADKVKEVEVETTSDRVMSFDEL